MLQDAGIKLASVATDIPPEAIRKGTRPKTALQIALETGQHSVASLLLKSGYRLDLERYAPLFDLLLEWGADLKSADVYHEMGVILGHRRGGRRCVAAASAPALDWSSDLERTQNRSGTFTGARPHDIGPNPARSRAGKGATPP